MPVVPKRVSAEGRSDLPQEIVNFPLGNGRCRGEGPRPSLFFFANDEPRAMNFLLIDSYRYVNAVFHKLTPLYV